MITGASRGLGFAVAKQLSTRNFNVICTARNSSPQLDELIESNHRVKFYSLDIGNLSTLQHSVKEILRDVGPVWGLINNAAIGKDGVLATMHEKDIMNMMNLNVTGAILVTKCVVRNMLTNRAGGAIVNVSSIIALTGYNGLAAYAASKAAMVGFSNSLARELGRANIRVNCISPGYMETDMTSGLEGDKLKSIMRRSALQRLTTTDEVAAAVDFLLSEGSSGITGTNLIVDAGSTA
jgi:3-oxoacyl-[acyl-carrier protein] reductase